MTLKIDKIDGDKEKELKDYMDEKGKVSVFKKLFVYSKPCILILVGVITALVAGAS